MMRGRKVRYTYAGRPIPRRPAYPGLLRRGRTVIAGPSIPRIVVQILAVALVALVALGGVLAMSAYSAYTQVAASLKPRLEALQHHQTFENSRIYDRNGTLLYEFFDAGRRINVDYDDISDRLIKATIAIEDKTFFSNPGVDYEGIARAMYQNVTTGEEVSGASTITQQVIKNIILTDEERSYENRYERKMKEIILAQELNRQYSKEQILEIYLNEVYYGNLAYGIEAASNSYFSTSAKDLNLPQAALLGGLPQLPSRYDPINFLQSDEQGEFLPGVVLRDGWLDPDYQLPEDVAPPKWRQVAVLRQMVDEEYISEAEARAAAAQDLRFAPQEVPLHAPHFVFYVRKMLEEKYGQQIVTGGGLNIYTTLDLNLQRMVQQKAREHITSLKERNIHNAAVVVLQPNTGQVLAMVGSIDYNAVESTSTPGEEGNVLDGQVNVVIRERQPGSALKPFTYLAAMERGMTPATILWDVPTEFATGNATQPWYAPKNYNGRWNGPVRIRTALANSLNMPAVKALKFAGIDYTLQLLDRVGIKNGLKRGLEHYGLSLTLGGGEVTLLELTTAYNTLASGGRYYPPTSIIRITDTQGNVVEAYQERSAQQVINPSLNGIITDMLSDDQARTAIWGQDSKLKLSKDAAVKTGTSEDWRDAWTVGYTPYVTVGVWSGNNNNEQTDRVESLQGGGIIWHNVMEEIFVWIEDNEYYRDLFSAPFPNKTIPDEFSLPGGDVIEERPICSIPGPFGGYDEELFTREMLLGTGIMTQTVTVTGTPSPNTNTKSKISGACDFYRSFTVVQIPGGGDDGKSSYCLPVSGQTYPPELIKKITYWNIPQPDPDERVTYQWSGGSAGAGMSPGNLQFCSASILATPTPTAPTAPVDGAVMMPNVHRMGETEAKNLLASMGITNVYIDYQTRQRVPDVFDQYAPYTVISSLPAPGKWVMPGSSVILGIRAPDDGGTQNQGEVKPTPPPRSFIDTPGGEATSAPVIATPTPPPPAPAPADENAPAPAPPTQPPEGAGETTLPVPPTVPTEPPTMEATPPQMMPDPGTEHGN